MTPSMALKIAAARSAPLRLHLAERADSTSLSRPPSGRRPGGQSWMRACVLANFPDAPNPRLLLLSLSCGACLAERMFPAGAKKGPRGRRATSKTQRLKNTFLQRVIPVEALRQPRRQPTGQHRAYRVALSLNRRARRRFHRMDLMADQPRGGRPANLLTKQQMAILQQPGAHLAGVRRRRRRRIAAQIRQPAALVIEGIDKKQPVLAKMTIDGQAILRAKCDPQLRRSLRGRAMRKWPGSTPCRQAMTRAQRAGDITAVAEGKLAAS